MPVTSRRSTPMPVEVAAAPGAAEIDADTQAKMAQIAADLKRDLLARGLSVEDIERLIPGAAQLEKRIHELEQKLEKRIHELEEKLIISNLRYG